MKKIAVLFLSLFVFFSVAHPVLAASIDPCPQVQGPGFSAGNNGTNFNPLCLFDITKGNPISKLINLVFVVAVLIALAFLIFGGIKWILSGGDKAGVEGARNTIVAALVGLVIVFLSYFLLRLILSIFGITLDHLNFDLNLFG